MQSCRSGGEYHSFVREYFPILQRSIFLLLLEIGKLLTDSEMNLPNLLLT